MPGRADQFKIAVIVQKMPSNLCFAVGELPVCMGSACRMAPCSVVVTVCSTGCYAIILAAARAGLTAVVLATRSSGYAANELRLGVVVHNVWVAFKTAVTDRCIVGFMIRSGWWLAYPVV